MRANEFVKKFGWLLSKAFAENWSDLAIHYGFNINDLKRLVESHELVREHGSIERAKDYAQSPYTAPEVSDRLNQAITSVESCQ